MPNYIPEEEEGLLPVVPKVVPNYVPEIDESRFGSDPNPLTGISEAEPESEVEPEPEPEAEAPLPESDKPKPVVGKKK